MTSLDFDFNNVKAEKTAAMRRYNRQKKLKSLLFVVEVLAALALLLWYSTYYVPVVSDVAADFLRRSVVVFGRHLYVFFIINVLVVVILALSLQKPSKPEFYDEYISITTTTKTTVSGRRASSDPAGDHSPAHDEPVTTTSTDRQVVFVDNAVHNPPAEQSIVRTTKTPPPSQPYSDHESSLAVSSVHQGKAGPMTETRKYRRTRSERYRKENRPELRRSETVIKRETTAVGVEEPRRSSSAMDDLSSEEFRSTIETFIAAKKKSLIRENTIDLAL